MKTTTWLLLFIILGIPTLAFGQYEAFQTANEAYRNENFTAAIGGYEKLLAEGYQSAELEYNLGNAYYRTNEIGEAILHYERTLRLNPGDKDVQHNLRIARQAVAGGAVNVLEFRAWKRVVHALTANGWSVLGLGLLWLAGAGFIMWQIAKARKYRKWGFVVGVALLVLSVLPFIMAELRSEDDATHDQAIILQTQVVLHSAPDPQSQEVQPIYEGAKVQLLDTIDNWYKIQLVDGEQGWLPEGAFERI